MHVCASCSWHLAASGNACTVHQRIDDDRLRRGAGPNDPEFAESGEFLTLGRAELLGQRILGETLRLSYGLQQSRDIGHAVPVAIRAFPNRVWIPKCCRALDHTVSAW